MRLNTPLVKGSKAPAWLWMIWLVGITAAFFTTRLFPDSIAVWVRIGGAVTALICTIVVKEKYDKDDRLANWIDSKFKKYSNGLNDRLFAQITPACYRTKISD